MMFGAKRSFRDLCDKINETTERANAMLEQNPDDEKALKMLDLVEHAMQCLEAAVFGERP